MKIIIDSQQNGEDIKIDLKDVIDNRTDEYVIFPREISYYIGYYNISAHLGNNKVSYSNGTTQTDIIIQDGLYTLQQYFKAIKSSMSRNGDNASNISYRYNEQNGRIDIIVTSPYKFLILKHQQSLLGYEDTHEITKNLPSEKAVNFTPHKMLYVHLKQLKTNGIYFNNSTSDILARLPVTNDQFGTFVNHKFDSTYKVELGNTTITSLELTITDNNNNVIDFHGMPIFYTLEVCKK